jgi:hypothetical protein
MCVNMLKDMVQAKDNNIILVRCIISGSCITKATETHWEYVIIIAFPRQQWLRELVSVQRYTYIPPLLSFTLRVHLPCEVSMLQVSEKEARLHGKCFAPCSWQFRSITSRTFSACPGVNRVIKGFREKEDNEHILAQKFWTFPIIYMEQFLSTSSGLLLLKHLSLHNDYLHRKWTQIKVKLEYSTYSKRVWNKWLCNFH